MMRFATLQDWLVWQEQLHPRTIDLGLERVAEVYRTLGLDRIARRTITVGGTNGKGSCVAFLEAIYMAQGYRVGAYTSPHILKYNERIRVNGEPIDDTPICEAFARIDAVRGNHTLSYFEFGTLAALEVFARAALDICIMEVGLGGRLDAVNVVDADVALVTTIGIDHVDWLGHTREAIGYEKAGIFRRSVPSVIGDPEPPESLLRAAEDKGARLHRIGKEFGYRKTAQGWDWFNGDQVFADLPVPAFKGEHQYRNASAVIAAVTALSDRLPVDEIAIRQGLANARLQGRFQLIDGQVPVLLDVGHNPQAVATLVEYLYEYFPAVKIRAVFAMMKDKDIAGVVGLMDSAVYSWYLAPLSNPRTASESQLRACFVQQGVQHVNGGFADFKAAFAAAQQDALPGELILVFGSFFLVSEYLATFTTNVR